MKTMYTIIEEARKAMSQLMADFEEARVDLARWIAKANTTITMVEVAGTDQTQEQEALIGEIADFGLGDLVTEGDFRATVTAVTDFAKNVSAGNDEAREEFMTMFTAENIVKEFRVVRCPNCGTVIGKSDSYCHECRSEVTPLTEYTAPCVGAPETKCACGRWIPLDYKFCPGCGKLNTSVEPNKLTVADLVYNEVENAVAEQAETAGHEAASDNTVGAIISSK